MNEKVKKYIEILFSPYEDVYAVKELKEELHVDLQEKFTDLKNQGHDDETAYQMTINSIGDIKEIIESFSVHAKEGKQPDSDFIRGMKEILEGIAKEFKKIVSKDLSLTSLQNSDFKGATLRERKFNYSVLSGADFSGADLTNSAFKGSDLGGAIFDGANLTRAKLKMAHLSETSFKECILDYTDFSYSSLSGVCLDNLTFNGTIFNCTGLSGTSFKNAVFKKISIKYSDFSKAILDGAIMDKVTYAVLKGQNADLTNITVL